MCRLRFVNRLNPTPHKHLWDFISLCTRLSLLRAFFILNVASHILHWNSRESLCLKAMCVKCVLDMKCCPTYFTHKVTLQIVSHKVTLQIVRLLGREAAELTLMWCFFFVVFLNGAGELAFWNINVNILRNNILFEKVCLGIPVEAFKVHSKSPYESLNNFPAMFRNHLLYTVCNKILWNH